MTVVGAPLVTLYVSSEQSDTDFMAVLHDVDPRGRLTYLQRGFLRSPHRALDPDTAGPHEPAHSHDKAEELVPGKFYEFRFRAVPGGARGAARARAGTDRGGPPDRPTAGLGARPRCYP